ncbi:MAG: hypothetical protein AAF333_06985 [Planctomycetota bacterium]
MNWLREHLKNALTYAPTDLLEIVTNYSVLRKDAGRLLPPESVTGSKTVLYERAHRLVIDAVRGTATPPGAPDPGNPETPPPSEPPPILFLEFGVFEGNSIRRWAGLNTHPDSRFVGFDSFEGLPIPWRQRPAGHFSTNGQPPAIDDPRVGFVKGWFHQTVPAALDDLGLLPQTTATREGAAEAVPDTKTAPETPTIPGAGVVVHIDADLYTSALFLLTELHRRLDRYHVLFDDYAAGEARALHAYLTAYGAAFEPLVGRKRRPRSRVPNQAFGLLTTCR